MCVCVTIFQRGERVRFSKFYIFTCSNIRLNYNTLLFFVVSKKNSSVLMVKDRNCSASKQLSQWLMISNLCNSAEANLALQISLDFFFFFFFCFFIFFIFFIFLFFIKETVVPSLELLVLCIQRSLSHIS